MSDNNIFHDFTQAPASLSKARSGFDLSHTHALTFNTADLVPVLVDEILPGDTISLNCNAIIRGITPLVPVMDNAFLDIAAFFVPNRLVWKDWKAFMGENTESAWIPQKSYSVPQVDIDLSVGNQTKAELSNCFYDSIGIPVVDMVSRGVTDISFSALYHRAYCLIYNEWYRDQNTQDPLLIETESIDENNEDSSSIVNSLLHGFLKVNKFHDYFTSALPGPQKGDVASVGLTGILPVLTGSSHQFFGDTNKNPLTFANASTPLATSGDLVLSGGQLAYNNTSVSVSGSQTYPDNLYVNVANTSITINALREAFAVQQLLEIDARSGTRYTEVLNAHFGVTSPDSRLQRPEYLGGMRTPINITEVVSTADSESSPLGTTGAKSVTFLGSDNITYSATEHGMLFVLAYVRTQQSYTQGLPRMFSRKDRFDFYWPVLANIGEQPILNKELFITDSSTTNNEVFGYQEAWASYRYKENRVSGNLNPVSDLGSYTYANSWATMPTLSASFIEENKSNVSRSLAVTNGPQWLSQFFFDYKVYREMPMYSIPGLQEL